MPTLVDCPFCGDGDFDHVGLKVHLQAGDCEVWNGIYTETILSRRIS